MSADAFIDSNVFIYQLDSADRRKQRIADGIVRQALADAGACISWQVVQECLNVAVGKAKVTLTPAQARDWLDVVLLPLLKVPPSAALYHRALDVRERWRFGFYDSLIVASALVAGCKTLYSEDLQHGQRIESLEIVDPFAA